MNGLVAGLISTTKEMAVFLQAVFDMRLFKKPTTLENMLDFSQTEKYGGHYGMGISHYQIDGDDYYGHGGYYGSLFIYSPEKKITFSANIGQANLPYDAEELVKNILDVVE